MKKHDISGHVIFCDDIRREVNGQSSYMGVYSGPVRMERDEETLPLFCVVVYLSFPSALTGKIPVVWIEKTTSENNTIELAKGDLPPIPIINTPTKTN